MKGSPGTPASSSPVSKRASRLNDGPRARAPQNFELPVPTNDEASAAAASLMNLRATQPVAVPLAVQLDDAVAALGGDVIVKVQAIRELDNLVFQQVLKGMQAKLEDVEKETIRLRQQAEVMMLQEEKWTKEVAEDSPAFEWLVN